jgi:hypothetical protein
MPDSKKLFPASLAILLIALALALLFATRPWATFTAIQHASVAKDYRALNKLVDFPALRASVKANLTRELEARTADSSSLGAQIGTMLGNIVIGPMVDLVVSPLGLAYILEGYSPQESASMSQSPGNAKSQPAPDISYVTRWDSLSQYAVELHKEGKLVSTLILRRYGWFEWKLAGVELVL